jgi:hypothetical protein
MNLIKNIKHLYGCKKYLHIALRHTKAKKLFVSKKLITIFFFISVKVALLKIHKKLHFSPFFIGYLVCFDMKIISKI